MLEIGTTLREARIRRGLEIADCESATKIRGKYLRALEEEQFDGMPGPTFARGFLRTYAEFLEVDTRSLVDEYESRVQRPREVSAHEEAVRRGRLRRRSRESRLLITATTLALIISVAVWTSVGGTASSAPRASEVTAVFSTAGRQPTFVEARQGGPEGEQLFTPGPIAAARPISVTVRPPIWVTVGDGPGLQLTVDGHTISTPSGRAEFKVLETGVILNNPNS